MRGKCVQKRHLGQCQSVDCQVGVSVYEEKFAENQTGHADDVFVAENQGFCSVILTKYFMG